MEELLKKLAKQLIAIDEASLTSLWNKYYRMVMRFEPTKKWEEAVLILCMIQAVKWKNQLFNTKLVEHTQTKNRFSNDFISSTGALEPKGSGLPILKKEQKVNKKAKILQFKDLKNKFKGV